MEDLAWTLEGSSLGKLIFAFFFWPLVPIMFPMCSHEVPQVVPQVVPNSLVCPKFNSHVNKLKKVAHFYFYFCNWVVQRGASIWDCLMFQICFFLVMGPINMAPSKKKKKEKRKKSVNAPMK